MGEGEPYGKEQCKDQKPQIEFSQMQVVLKCLEQVFCGGRDHMAAVCPKAASISQEEPNSSSLFVRGAYKGKFPTCCLLCTQLSLLPHEGDTGECSAKSTAPATLHWLSKLPQHLHVNS